MTHKLLSNCWCNLWTESKSLDLQCPRFFFSFNVPLFISFSPGHRWFPDGQWGNVSRYGQHTILDHSSLPPVLTWRGTREECIKVFLIVTFTFLLGFVTFDTLLPLMSLLPPPTLYPLSPRAQREYFKDFGSDRGAKNPGHGMSRAFPLLIPLAPWQKRENWDNFHGARFFSVRNVGRCCHKIGM